MAVIEAVCAERGCELRCPDFADLAVEPLAGAVGWGSGTSGDALDEAGASAPPVPPRRRFTYRGRPFETHLLGSYQPFNAALALAACEELRERGWTIPEEACRAGIAAVRWPGRFEVVGTFPLTIVDGGHNPQGAEALASSLADLLGEAGRGSVHFALGVLADKDYPAMVRAVAPWAASFSVYAPENPRALAAHELAACARDVLAEEVRSGAAVPRGGAVPVSMCASPAAAFAAARDAAGSEGVAVAFGTLYAIADLTNASGCR